MILRFPSAHRHLTRVLLATLLLGALAACNRDDGEPTPEAPAPELTLLAPDVPAAGQHIDLNAEQTLQVITRITAEGGLSQVQYLVEAVDELNGWDYDASTPYNAQTEVRDTVNIYFPASAPAGIYRVRIIATDLNGNSSALHANMTVNLSNPNDLSAPTITLNSPNPDELLVTTAGSSVTLVGTLTDDGALASLQVRLTPEGSNTGTSLLNLDLGGVSTYTLNENVAFPASLSAGNYTLMITVSDQALNVATRSIAVQITD